MMEMEGIEEEHLNPNQIPVHYSVTDSIRKHLQNIPLNTIIPPPEHRLVTWVFEHDKVTQALEIFSTYHVSSCPVWSQTKKCCVGLIDVTDLVALVVKLADTYRPRYMRSIVTGNALSDKDTLDKQRAAWDQQKIESVMNLCGTNDIAILNYDQSVYDALVILAQGIHRIPMVSEDGTQIVAIISQSTIMEYLYSHLDEMGDIPKKLIQQILHTNKVPLSKSKVICVQENELVIDAFKKITSEQITAVAVTSETSKIMGVISATDIRWIYSITGLNDMLYVQAGEFVRFIQPRNENVVSPVVSVTLTDTVGIAISKVVDNKIHRVFVVRSHDDPRHAILSNVLVGVLSLKDLLLCFVSD